MKSIRENIFRKSARQHRALHESIRDSAIGNLNADNEGTVIEQNRAIAITHHNIAVLLGSSFDKLDSDAVNALMRVLKASSAAQLNAIMEPIRGRRGGWQQHVREHLASIAGRLAGKPIPREDKPVAAFWPIVEHMAITGESVSRAEFSRIAAASKGKPSQSDSALNGNYGGLLSLLSVESKGFCLLVYDKVNREYRATDKLRAILAQ